VGLESIFGIYLTYVAFLDHFSGRWLRDLIPCIPSHRHRHRKFMHCCHNIACPGCVASFRQMQLRTQTCVWCSSLRDDAPALPHSNTLYSKILPTPKVYVIGKHYTHIARFFLENYHILDRLSLQAIFDRSFAHNNIGLIIPSTTIDRSYANNN